MQQQIGACCHSVGLSPDTDAMMLTGEDLPETRAELWRRRRLIFCTPHILTLTLALTPTLTLTLTLTPTLTLTLPGTPHILRNDLANGLVDGKRIVLQHGQSAPLGSARGRPLRLLRARLAALGSSAFPERGQPSVLPPTASGARASRLQSRSSHRR